MMKKVLPYLFACLAILLILANCAKDNSEDKKTKPNGSEPGVSVSIPGLTLPEKVAAPVAERENTGPLIDYDAGRELYIMTGYNDCVYYLKFSSDCYYSFYIFSRSPLDAASISLEIPVEHPYSVTVKEIEMEGLAPEGETVRKTQFPYELYQCYQGKDFRKLTELRWELSYKNAAWNHAYRWLENAMSTFEEVDEVHQEAVDQLYTEYKTASNDYLTFLDAEREAYEALKRADLPQFYVYNVMAFFPPYNIEHIPDETFTEITVTIGDQVYHQQIGQVTLKSGKLAVFDQRDWANNSYNADDGIIGLGNYPLPYNDGTSYIMHYFSIDKVDCYKVLTKLVLDNPNQKLEAVWIELTPEGGTTRYYNWDMSEPFELYPGDSVYIDIVYSDDYMDEHYLGYRTKVYGYLEYESDGETWYKISECSITNTMNLYLLYAIIFDGLDVESYYWDYYYVMNEGWRFDADVSPFEKLPFRKG